MPAFYFHVQGPISLRDAVGKVLPDTDAAQAHARRLMGNFERQHDGNPVEIVVVDESGGHVWTLKSRTH